jgi:uncharacterized membrane protein YfcA
VDTELFIFLALTAGVTSLVTASFGVGGGVLLLAVMAVFLPPQVIVPVHGVVQLGSNAGRALLSWRNVDWRVIAAFVPGALAGAVVGSFVLIALPPAAIYTTIAAFTLYLCWGPRLPRTALGAAGTSVLGAGTTFLTLFVGATGPLVGAFLRQQHDDRFKTVATFATAMAVQHTLKLGVFQLAGFDLKPWLALAAAMIACGAAGTFIGLRLLRRFSDRHFQLVFKLLLTLLALRLLWQALE